MGAVTTLAEGNVFVGRQGCPERFEGARAWFNDPASQVDGWSWENLEKMVVRVPKLTKAG